MTDVASLQAKIEKAIAAGKERGIDTSAWEQKLKLLAQAQEVAIQTCHLLATRGWCLWKCTKLNSETIAVVRDESVAGVPPGYATYTEDELEKLCRGKSSTIRLIHKAKKLGGAKIIEVEQRRT